MTKLISGISTDKFLEIMQNAAPFLKEISFNKADSPTGSYPIPSLARYKSRMMSGRNQVANLTNMNDYTINWNLKEIVLATIIPDSYVEDSKTSGKKIANYIGNIFGLDLQYLFLNGDTETDLSSLAGEALDKATLAKSLDGIVKIIKNKVGHSINYAKTATMVDKINNIIKAMPDNAIYDPEMKIYVGSTQFTQLWNEITTDSAKKALLLTKDNKISIRQKEVIEIPELSKIMVINPKHIVGSLGRNMNIETQRYPEARASKVVLSARIDLDAITEHAYIEGSEEVAES